MNRPPAVGDMDTRSDCSNIERLGGRRIFPMPFSLILYFSIHKSLCTTASSKERLSWSEDLVFKYRSSASFPFLFAPESTTTLTSTGCSFRSNILFFGAEFLTDFFLLLTLAFDLIFQPLNSQLLIRKPLISFRCSPIEAQASYLSPYPNPSRP